MARIIPIEPNATYKTKENAIKAVEKVYGPSLDDGLHYLVVCNAEGRFYPIFVGNEAIARGAHMLFCTTN